MSDIGGTNPPFDLIIRGGRVLVEGAEGLAFQRMDLGIRDGLIASSEPALDGAASEHIDAHDGLVTPGFINTHTHSYSACSAGMAADAPLAELIPRARRVAGTLSDLDQYRLARAHAELMLLAGVTGLIDQPAQGIAAPHAVAEAYRDAGIRAVIAPMVFDGDYAEWLPADLVGDLPSPLTVSTEQTLAGVREFVTSWLGAGDLVKPAVGPFAPGMCSDRLLGGLAELSAEFDVPLHTHLAEASWQAEHAKAAGQTLVTRMHRLGALSERASVAHAVWVDDADIEVLAETRTTIAHNPLSNLILGSGIAPVPRMRKAGINVTLGSDGLNCGCVADFFEHMRLAVGVHRPAQPDWTGWHGASDVLRWATTGGARALGRGNDLGRIERGAVADLVVHRPPDRHAPQGDEVTTFVYTGSSAYVSDVVVGGAVRVQAGRLRSEYEP